MGFRFSNADRKNCLPGLDDSRRSLSVSADSREIFEDVEERIGKETTNQIYSAKTWVLETSHTSDRRIFTVFDHAFFF